MPKKIDIEEVVDKVSLSAKIEQALLESERSLGQDFNEFKEEWLKKEFIDRNITPTKIEKALDQLANGQYMTSEELDEEIKRWIKDSNDKSE